MDGICATTMILLDLVNGKFLPNLQNFEKKERLFDIFFARTKCLLLICVCESV